MKILSIRLKNLASLAGEHFIDFESEPLSSTGLIAIVGKTGAGKSSILDAMCLALFNRVPRLKDSDGKLTDVDGSELQTNSPLTVLRRGCGMGFAELSFVAQDQKVYSARWEIKRARENPTGKLQSVQRSLKCLTDGVVVADKAKAVETSIQQIAQLSFDQFTRAVLLAQSEVTAFLKARDSERGELLEYLTNSSIFAKVGQLAFEKTKQITNQLKEIESFSGRIEILSDEDFNEINATFESINTEYKKLETEKFNLQKQHQWFEQKQKYEDNAQTLQQQLRIQQQQIDALAPEKLQLQQLERFASVRPYVIQNSNFHTDLEKLNPLLKKVQQEFNSIEKRYTAEKLNFENIEIEQKQQQQFEIQHQKNIQKVRDRIAERKVLIQQLRKAQSEFKELENQLTPHLNNEKQTQEQIEQLKNNFAQHTIQLESSDHFSPLDDALSAHTFQVQRFIQSYEQFEHQYGDLQQANQQLFINQKQLDELTHKFGQENELSQKISALRSERDELLQQFNHFNVVQHQWQNLQQVETEYRKLKRLENDLTQQITQIKIELTSADVSYQEQKIAREQLQKILQQQRLLNTENIEKLRAELVDGEACLVCGSTHHPYVDKTAFSDELLKLQEQQEHDALESENQAFEIWQKLHTKFTQQNASLDANTKQLTTLTTQRQQLQSEFETQLSILNIVFDFSENHDVLTQIIQTQKVRVQNTQQQLESSLTTYENVQKRRHELKQSIQNTAQHLSNVQRAESNIQHILSLQTAPEKQAWESNTLKASEQLYTNLQQRRSKLIERHECEVRLGQKSQQLEQYEQQVKFSQEKILSAENTIDELKSLGKKNSDIAIEVIFSMTAKTVEKPHEWLMEFEQDRQNLQLKFNLVCQSFDQIHESFEAIQSRLKGYLTQQSQLHAQIKHVQDIIQKWLVQHPDFNLALFEQLSSISFEQEQQLKQRVSEIKRAYTDVQAGIKTIQVQLKQHLEQQPKLDFQALNQRFSSLIQNMHTLAEQRDELKLKLEVHHLNVTKQKEFAEQIQKIKTEEHRWSKISSLMGDSTGKKFRDYAQQYNLDILLEYANQQLAMLSQRYTLKRLENSLSLAIIDHQMDGEIRSVSSLSGGESFLTALALSLAIANMASGSMKIESLFIDEGFGTLDPASLHMVMNALDHLQSQGRKVVLISHIQEMHERIPVQIQVKPLGSGASTIKIVG
ncbi:AAA family ATPase [uncultured Acinetobacter sp.]|uniref:AAA family ATPase n=1 Tax=uncultured Acinetobacter sp. TaxID=165433 RepID=UPI00261AF5CB|nr:AAA family ATPase [uncultured Acinetobacter sp.]